MATWRQKSSFFDFVDASRLSPINPKSSPVRRLAAKTAWINRKMRLNEWFTPTLSCLTFFIFGGPAWSQSDDDLSFQRDIRPILSDKCFACHGPDTKEDKLVRLDLENLAKIVFCKKLKTE